MPAARRASFSAVPTLARLDAAFRRQDAAGEPAVLLVPGSLRPLIARLTRHTVPGLAVLAYHEVPEDKRLRVVGSVG